MGEIGLTGTLPECFFESYDFSISLTFSDWGLNLFNLLEVFLMLPSFFDSIIGGVVSGSEDVKDDDDDDKPSSSSSIDILGAELAETCRSSSSILLLLLSLLIS